MLCDMLASHPTLACPHEYLDTNEENANWRAALDALAAKTGKKAIGHVQAKYATDEMLNDPDTRRLLLFRDPRKSALSFLRVSHERPGWTLDPVDFRAEVNKREAAYKRLRPFADAVVTYEELTNGENTLEAPEPVATRLCGFFGVPVIALRTMIRKNQPSFPTNWKDL